MKNRSGNDNYRSKGGETVQSFALFLTYIKNNE